MATVPDMTVKLEVLGLCKSCRHLEIESGASLGWCARASAGNPLMWSVEDGGVFVRPDFGCVMWEGKDAD